MTKQKKQASNEIEQEKHAKRILLKGRSSTPEKHKDVSDDYLIKLLKIYNTHLNSGIDNVTSICNYTGLTQLTLGHHKHHPAVKAIIATHENKRTQGEKDALVAYGYQILMGNV